MNARVAGEQFNFHRRNALVLHDSWRALDCAVARWVLAHAGSMLLAQVAAWASFAEGQGDSALPLRGSGAGHSYLPSWDDSAIADLAKQPMVGRAGALDDAPQTPFVLDGNAFYLRRNWCNERAVAMHLRARRQVASTTASLSDADLRLLFDNRWSDAESLQRGAVRQVLGKRLFVLTGGPGTGKTSTVLRMLLALSRAHGQANADHAPLICISAPTGKAAQRLGDALRAGGSQLHGLDAAFARYLPGVLAASVSTLHRLLGSRGRHGGFGHHADNRLPADIVVVDEASMMDLSLLRALLDALRDDAVLVLVGDAEQLASVASGSVMRDIVRALEHDGSNDLVRLQHSFRADTRLLPINDAVRCGDVEAFEQAWQYAADDGKATRQAVHTLAELAPRLRSWALRLHASLDRAGAFASINGNDDAALARVMGALREQQLLCALRETPFGAVAANALLEQLVRRELDAYRDALWYPGRAVMIVRNDPASGLFNGDVGLCLRTADDAGGESLQVWFEVSSAASDDSGTSAWRSFSPGGLPAHEGAFALTVHKSQGSEYQHVAVLLPADADNPLLSRQMLYTALSRAKQSVELWASPASVRRALETVLARNAQLTQRLLHTQHKLNPQ